MAEISHETEKLLFKLYNLKSSESTVITDILNKKSNIGEMIEEARTAKDETEQERERLERELSDFTSQKDSFFEAFGGLKDVDFAALKAIGVNVEVEPLVSSVSEKAPEYEDSLRSKIEAAKAKIVELFGQISGYGADLDGAEEELQRAEVDRQALASLVEQSLSGNESDSLSKQYIRSILSNFNDFTEEEITELCKIILFPEDVLSEFDRTYEERKAKAEEAPAEETPAKVEEPKKEEGVGEAPINFTETAVVVDAPKADEPTDIVTLVSDEETPAEDKEEEKEIPEETTVIYGAVQPEEEHERAPVEEVVEEAQDKKPSDEPEVRVEGNTITFGDEPEIKFNIEEAPTTVIDLSEVQTALKEDERRIDSSTEIEDFMSELGLQTDKFPQNELNKIYDYLKNVDSNLIKNNYELLRSINADEEAYVYANGHMYITDPELSEKINFLRSKSISEKKIKEIITSSPEDSIFRKTFSTIKERVEAMERVDGSITDDNIEYIEQDTALYEKNMDLVTKTFELDDKELRNFKPILFSPYVIGDMKVLKEYLLSIVKQDNGRYALNTLAQRPIDLVEGIDGLVENGLEDLTTSNPEVLELNLEELLKRIEVLRNKGVTLYDEETETFAPELIDYTAYAEKYGIEVPELKSYKEVNRSIAPMVGNEDFTQLLVETLDTYYSNPEIDPEVNVEDETKAKYEQLLASFEEMLNASKVGNLTYKIGDVFVSRTKLERHIKLLLKALAKQGQEIEGVEKEVILTSLLYNLRGDEEKLKEVVDTCLGFNKGEEVGGPSL